MPIRSSDQLCADIRTAQNRTSRLLADVSQGAVPEPAFHLFSGQKHGNSAILQLNQVQFGFGKPLQEPLDCQLMPGQRIALCGPNGSGIADGTLPEINPKAALWKVPIPGRGVSSPIIVGGKVFLQAASDDGTTLTLVPDLLQPDKPITILKSQIESMTPTLQSPMPAGLLNTFSKEEILDLLSLLESQP